MPKVKLTANLGTMDCHAHALERAKEGDVIEVNDRQAEILIQRLKCAVSITDQQDQKKLSKARVAETPAIEKARTSTKPLGGFISPQPQNKDPNP